MDNHELTGPFTRLLEDICSPAEVRSIETGAPTYRLWGGLQDSGFLDILKPESAGGAGVALSAAGGVLQALGRYVTPAPVAETMLARALLAMAGVEAPDGPIVLARMNAHGSAVTPFARVATHALVEHHDTLTLTCLDGAEVRPTGLPHDLAARIDWNAPPTGPRFTAPRGGARVLGAMVRAAAIAGAVDRVLEITVAYANDRNQFGKPIGKQQAVQQQLAVLAEQAVASRIASEIGLASGFPPAISAVAVAKQITSHAAALAAEIAHAVHGAIGVTQEHDLQLFTRRLYEWRFADGSESYWAEQLGASRVTAAGSSSVDFVRAIA